MCGMSAHVENLAFKVWRDQMKNMVHSANFKWSYCNQSIIGKIRAKLAHFEDELNKLREITSILELALWKLRMDQANNQENETRPLKRGKTDESSARLQCRVTCGADVVIGHVLPYLIAAADEEFASDADSDSNSSDDEELPPNRMDSNSSNGQSRGSM
jgi:hypothetical protein